MKIEYSKSFKKLYKKSPKHVQQAFDTKLLLFIQNQKDISLNIHRLHGKYSRLYSMNVTGDIRAIFDKKSNAIVKFIVIGSHSELYS